jgi:ribosome-associated protein
MARQDLRIAPGIAIPEDEILETASRSRGPGGQNVNKTETRVTLRWCLLDSRALQGPQRARLLRVLAPRLTREGELIVRSDRFRSRARNRDAARERLAALVSDALAPRVPRIPTRPSRASAERRLAAKRGRAEQKRRRGPVREGES